MKASASIHAAFAIDFLNRLKSHFEARDVDALVSHTTDDLVYNDMGEGHTLDREGLRQLWLPLFEAMAAARAELKGVYLGTDGPTVAANWMFTLTRADTAEPIEFETVALYTFRNGKISRWTTMFRNVEWMGEVWP